MNKKDRDKIRSQERRWAEERASVALKRQLARLQDNQKEPFDLLGALGVILTLIVFWAVVAINVASWQCEKSVSRIERHINDPVDLRFFVDDRNKWKFKCQKAYRALRHHRCRRAFKILDGQL